MEGMGDVSGMSLVCGQEKTAVPGYSRQIKIYKKTKGKALRTMAQGKGGKADPHVMGKDDEQHKNIVKLSQIKRIMKDETRMRVSRDALKVVSAGMVYIISEIIDGSRNVANTDGKKKIMPKHINSAIYNDTELHFIGHDWLIKNGGAKSSIIPGEISGMSKKASKD